MSSRTIQRLVISSTLVFGGLAVGCGDDDPKTDGGTTGEEDGGTTGEEDGGTTGEEDAAPEQACGHVPDIDESDCLPGLGDECCVFTLVTGPICPCAFEKPDGSEVCGVSADDIKKINPSSAFEGCVERDAPGVESDAAGVFFDKTASDDKTELEIAFAQPGDQSTCDVDFTSDTGEDGKFNIFSETLGGLSYNGCCTETGQFGVNLSASIEYANVNAHLGCKGFADLQSSLGSDAGNEEPCLTEKDAIDARTDRNEGVLPYCDPTTGDMGAPPVMTALCAQLPALTPQAFPVVCTGAEPTPDWVKATIFMEAVAPTFPDDCVQLLSDAATSCALDAGVPQPDGTCIPVAGADALPGCVSAN